MEACARTSSLETVYLLHLFWPASGKTNPATKDKDSTIEAGKDIAFANKDTLIAGGPLVLPLTRKNKMSGYVAQLRRVGKRHGVWHFNQMLLHEEAQIAARWFLARALVAMVDEKHLWNFVLLCLISFAKFNAAQIISFAEIICHVSRLGLIICCPYITHP
ncbi:hypothetical protein Vadar_016354 [Vaccinium darrowii]|nr:hypothetical protein Vadar_016354 [Vaccinium darrowii]